MKFTIGFKGYLAIICAILASGLAGQVMAVPGERLVQVPVGSTWTFETRNTGSYGSANGPMIVRSEQREWQGKPVRAVVFP